MQKVEHGSTVTLAFTGTTQAGDIFGEATSEKPLRFTVGNNDILAGVEEAVIGMVPGESKTTTLSPQKGFGIHSDDKVLRIPQTNLPEDFKGKVDDDISLKNKEGELIPARITEITPSEVVVDANHPLAGEELTMDLKVLTVEPR